MFAASGVFTSDFADTDILRNNLKKCANRMILSPEWRFSAYYAALFASIGSIAPFFAVWLDSQGVDAHMIGIIAAAPSLVMILTTVPIGRWADSLRERRTAIIICNVLILAAQLVLFQPLDPLVILVVWTFTGILMFAKVPVTDAAALSITHQRNSDFARVRVFGSVGFAVALAVSGYVYDIAGMIAFIPILCLGNFLRLWMSCLLPVSGRSESESSARQSVVKSSALYQPGVVLTIVASALIQASHAVVYTFGILLWTQLQGLSETTGSLLIAIGVVAEVILMWRFKSLTRNLSARGCLLIAAACGILRWAILAMSPPLWLVYTAQLMHAMTFGLTFLATASFIAQRVGEANAARGQGFAATVATALMATMTYIAGHLHDVAGMHLYWLMSGVCGVAVLLVGLSYLTRMDDVRSV